MRLMINELREIITEVFDELAGEEALQEVGKKTAKKTLRTLKKHYGKTFKSKEKAFGWADDPAVAEASLIHKATGKWPHKKD